MYAPEHWSGSCRTCRTGCYGPVLSLMRIIVRMREPDCFLRYRISAATRNFTPGKSDVYVLGAAARHGFKMVLRPTATVVLFTKAVSRRHTFVGGTCAPPSAITRSHGSVTSVVRATRQVNGRRQIYPSYHTHTP